MTHRPLIRCGAVFALLMLAGAVTQGLAFAAGGLEVEGDAPTVSAVTQPVQETTTAVVEAVEDTSTAVVEAAPEPAQEPVKEVTGSTGGTVESTTQEVAETTNGAPQTSQSSAPATNTSASTSADATSSTSEPAATSTSSTSSSPAGGTTASAGESTGAQDRFGTPEQAASEGPLVAQRDPSDPDKKSPKEVLQEVVSAGQGIEGGVGAAVKGRTVRKGEGGKTSVIARAEEAVKLALTGLRSHPYVVLALALIAVGYKLRRRAGQRPLRHTHPIELRTAVLAARLPFGAF